MTEGVLFLAPLVPPTSFKGEVGCSSLNGGIIGQAYVNIISNFQVLCNRLQHYFKNKDYKDRDKSISLPTLKFKKKKFLLLAD